MQWIKLLRYDVILRINTLKMETNELFNGSVCDARDPSGGFYVIRIILCSLIRKLDM